MIEQRPDETREEFYDRRHETAKQQHLRGQQLYEFAPEPKDLYADWVTFDESYGVLRLTFQCSRPDSTDEFDNPFTVPVARLSLPLQVFKGLFKEWLESQARRQDE